MRIAVLILILSYLSICFITLEFNFMDWSENNRVVYVIISILGAGFGWIYSSLKEDFNKD